MTYLAAFPVLLAALMIQVAVASNLPLLGGTADLIMVVLIAWALQERVKGSLFWGLVGGGMVSAISALPAYSPLLVYPLIIGMVRVLKKRVWQIPILVMFLSIVLGTVFQHLVYLILIFFNGLALPIQESLSWITLPSILLNLLVALPVYVVITDIAGWLYPAEVSV